MLLELGKQGPGGLGQPSTPVLTLWECRFSPVSQDHQPLASIYGSIPGRAALGCTSTKCLAGEAGPLSGMTGLPIPSWGPGHHPQETEHLLSTSPRPFSDPAVQRTCLLRSLLEGGELREGTTPCCFWLILRTCHHPLARRGGSTCRQSSGPRQQLDFSHLLFCRPPANRSLALPVPFASSGHSSSSHTGFVNASAVSGQVTSR